MKKKKKNPKLAACHIHRRGDRSLDSGGGGEGSVGRGGRHAGRRAGPVAAQAGFAGVQDCFEQEWELLQRDVYQLSCEDNQI